MFVPSLRHPQEGWVPSLFLASLALRWGLPSKCHILTGGRKPSPIFEMDPDPMGPHPPPQHRRPGTSTRTTSSTSCAGPSAVASPPGAPPPPSTHLSTPPQTMLLQGTPGVIPHLQEGEDSSGPKKKPSSPQSSGSLPLPVTTNRIPSLHQSDRAGGCRALPLPQDSHHSLLFPKQCIALITIAPQSGTDSGRFPPLRCAAPQVPPRLDAVPHPPGQGLDG